MLKVKRKAGEVVVITTADGDEIQVTVDSIEGRAARLSIEAPQRVRIDRLEIHERRKADGG
jgi:carbon storage regulator CsrA